MRGSLRHSCLMGGVGSLNLRRSVARRHAIEKQQNQENRDASTAGQLPSHGAVAWWTETMTPNLAKSFRDDENSASLSTKSTTEGRAHPASLDPVTQRHRVIRSRTPDPAHQPSANPCRLVLRHEASSILHGIFIQRPRSQRNARFRFRRCSSRLAPKFLPEFPQPVTAAFFYNRTYSGQYSPRSTPRASRSSARTRSWEHPSQWGLRRCRRTSRMPVRTEGQPQASTSTNKSLNEPGRRLKTAGSLRTGGPRGAEERRLRPLGIRIFRNSRNGYVAPAPQGPPRPGLALSDNGSPLAIVTNVTDFSEVRKRAEDSRVSERRLMPTASQSCWLSPKVPACPAEPPVTLQSDCQVTPPASS